jgi:hypothetical protein
MDVENENDLIGFVDPPPARRPAGRHVHVRPAIKSDEVGGRAGLGFARANWTARCVRAARPATARHVTLRVRRPGAWHEPWELAGAGEDRAHTSIYLSLICFRFVFSW